MHFKITVNGRGCSGLLSTIRLYEQAGLVNGVSIARDRAGCILDVMLTLTPKGAECRNAIKCVLEFSVDQR